MHGLNGSEFERLVGLGALEFLDAAKAAGTIRFAGFSFHDEAPAFAPIVDAYDWDFCQIQYNFMDMEYQAGAAGLAHAAAKGLAVVVMEPLKGGRLAGTVPAPIQAVWDEACRHKDSGRVGTPFCVGRPPGEPVAQWHVDHGAGSRERGDRLSSASAKS